MTKSDDAYKTIGEVAKILGLNDNKKGTLATHTIRFWEKEFKQIRPKILNGNRRYFDNKNIDLLNFEISSSLEWEKYIKSFLEDNNAKVAFGGYLEKRNIYDRSDRNKIEGGKAKAKPCYADEF